MKHRNRLADLQLRMRRRAEPKPARGRPRLPITPAVVQQLAGVGFDDKGIARTLGCSVKTLQRRFAPQLRLGRALITADVKIQLVENALYHRDRRALLLLAKGLKWDN
jgi:AraC-like DNA-binding protein